MLDAEYNKQGKPDLDLRQVVEPFQSSVMCLFY